MVNMAVIGGNGLLNMLTNWGLLKKMYGIFILFNRRHFGAAHYSYSVYKIRYTFIGNQKLNLQHYTVSAQLYEDVAYRGGRQAVSFLGNRPSFKNPPIYRPSHVAL